MVLLYAQNFRKAILLLVFLVLAGQLMASEDTDVPADKSSKFKTVKDFFQQSTWHLHTRTFLMSTVNQGNLKDDIALAQGAGIGLLTKPIKGFQFGLSGYFIFNVASTNLAEPDPITGAANRYELGQFDIKNPQNRADLDRLEELFVRYTFRKSNITIGRMELVTPFMNPQDGRMRPTLEEGIWLTVKESEKIGFNGGYIRAVSPRSTVDWHSVGQTLGTYPSGINVDGSKSNYKNNIHSNAFLMGNLYFKPTEKMLINVWNGYFHNVMNTVLLESKNEVQLDKKNIKFYQSLMFVHQNAVKDGGNADPSKTYINKGAVSNVVSAQLGFKNKRFDTNLNYTHISKEGRYLMPREWGRDPFYTFMPRERNEGMGNVHAVSANSTLHWLSNKFSTALGYGYFKLPEVKDFKLNKYGVPSYHQINFSSNYRFDNFWKGLEIRMLIASKFKADKNVVEPKYIYNKVNMVNFNLIVDLKI